MRINLESFVQHLKTRLPEELHTRVDEVYSLYLQHRSNAQVNTHFLSTLSFAV